MKSSLQYRLALIAIPLLFLSSCLKEELDPIIQGPGPTMYLENWKEIERRIGNNNWEAIEYGDTLTLSLDDIDASKKKLSGQYSYNPINLNLELDKTGDVVRGEDYILFMSFSNLKDSIHLPVQLIQDQNDPLLVIFNTLSTPRTEVKYKKLK